jgi:glycine/D-amino acid oxidase-like deaminating enzyme
MIKSVGIVGSGLIGRLLAYRLIQDGYAVHIFDRDDEKGELSCGWVGAGMLSPYSELGSADELIFSLGKESLKLWPQIIASLAKPVFFQHAGTLAVAHQQDRLELSRFQSNVERKLDSIVAIPELDQCRQAAAPKVMPQGAPGEDDASEQNSAQGEDSVLKYGGAPREDDAFREKSVRTPLGAPTSSRHLLECDSATIAKLEPELSRQFHDALYIADEGQIDNRQLFDALTCTLKASGAPWHCGVHVKEIKAHQINFENTNLEFDLVIDTRGLGSKTDLPRLRGVRGELIRVLAPEVKLHRPIRVMHPRYPLYVVPRPNQHYIIGATSIESENEAPMTVQSALELLSAAFSIHTGFAEASILEMQARCRPALIDNAPKIYIEPGLMRINGLYRHGFLISPKLVDVAISLITNNLKIDSLVEIDPIGKSIIVENAVSQPIIGRGKPCLPASVHGVPVADK